MAGSQSILKIVGLVLVGLCAGSLCAQTAAPAAPPSQEVAGEPAGMVTLNLPEEVELKTLIDYIGKRRGINFLYDEQIAGRKVSIKSNQQIPAASMMALLESALKMKGLTLAPTDVPGMMRIELTKQLTSVSAGVVQKEGDSGGGGVRSGIALTRVFEFRHANQQRIEQMIVPFLSVPTANVTVLPDLGLVVVTDYAENMKKIEELLSLIDRPGRKIESRFVPVVNVEAATLAQKLTALMTGRAKARGGSGGGPGTASGGDPMGGVTVLPDERTNQLAILGPTSEVEEAAALVAALDTPLGLETKVYAFTVAAPEQVDRLVKSLIGEVAAKRLYKSTIDRDTNLLVVAATPEIHNQIDALVKTLDKPAAEKQSPIRFYKLENAKAADVLVTLQGIEGDSGLRDASIDGLSSASAALRIPSTIAYKGPNEADANATVAPPLPGEESVKSARRARQPLQLRDARIMADEPSNTIIIIAEPAMQGVYEKLIRRLDVRQPQVLIEATVIAMDTTDGFQLGVEISKTGSVNGGEGRLLNFSSFGLSEVDKNTGALTIKPGLGFNGALVSADIANIVIRALESNSRVKVLSRPSVLINDNAIGKLASQNEEPFSTVSASGVAGATTSFGGFASAGTSIEVSPQISEGEHLKLKYKIELSSFSSSSSTTTGGTTSTLDLPPARQKNVLESEATIPDGFTIIVGGLTRESYRNTIDRVPILGRIPVVEYLFSNRSTDKSQATLFLFIRAVILRDDQFKDLKAVTGEATRKTDLPSPPDAPASEPVELH